MKYSNIRLINGEVVITEITKEEFKDRKKLTHNENRLRQLKDNKL